MAASIKCDERPFRGGVWGGFAPPAKNRGVWEAAPPSQTRKFFEMYFHMLNIIGILLSNSFLRATWSKKEGKLVVFPINSDQYKSLVDHTVNCFTWKSFSK